MIANRAGVIHGIEASRTPRGVVRMVRIERLTPGGESYIMPIIRVWAGRVDRTGFSSTLDRRRTTWPGILSGTGTLGCAAAGSLPSAGAAPPRRATGWDRCRPV